MIKNLLFDACRNPVIAALLNKIATKSFAPFIIPCIFIICLIPPIEKKS